MADAAAWNEIVNTIAAYQRDQPRLLPGAVIATDTPRHGRFVTAVGTWSTDAICTIGSMSKVFVAVATLLALEDHDALDVDRPVCSFPGMEMYGDGVRRQIRVRHLLQHTSGLPNLTAVESRAALQDLADAVNDDDDWPNVGPSVPWVGAPGITNELIRVDGRLRRARQLSLDVVSQHVMERYELLHAPGAQSSYSTSNHVVAARLIERLTGYPLNQYLRERLFTPFGMTDSFFIAAGPEQPGASGALDDGVTEGQRRRIPDVALLTRDGRIPPEVAPGPDGQTWDKFRRGWRYVYPDAGMYSTASDLLTFLSIVRDAGHLNGRQLLSPTVHHLLTQDQGFSHTMAFGFRRRTTPAGQGPGTLEHMGNLMTYFWYAPEPVNRIGVFLSQRMCNAAVNNNMAEGMEAIFKVFVPSVWRRTALQPGAVPPAVIRSDRAMSARIG